MHEAYKLSNKAVAILDALEAPLALPLRWDTLAIIGVCTDIMSTDKRLEGLEVRKKCSEIRQRCHDMIPSGLVTTDDRIRLHDS